MKFLASAAVLALFLTNSESVDAERILDNDSEKLKLKMMLKATKYKLNYL